jgi:hypothetical protein
MGCNFNRFFRTKRKRFSNGEQLEWLLSTYSQPACVSVPGSQGSDFAQRESHSVGDSQKRKEISLWQRQTVSAGAHQRRYRNNSSGCNSETD